MDQISSLPDDLLRRVLSFLTTKEAGVTSVLAKRWRKLFRSVPILDLDDSVFLHPEKRMGRCDEIHQSFLVFVSKVLAFRGDSLIEKFSLKYNSGVDKDYVRCWIGNVLERGVLDVDLLIEDIGCVYGFPSEILKSETLVKLKIASASHFDFDKQAQLFLPRLKTLILDSVPFYDGQLQKLLFACPALEELEMSNTLEELEMSNIYGENREVTVSSATLKTLKIDVDEEDDADEANVLRVFSLDTPNLLCLDYYGFTAEEYPVLNLGSLVEARIELIFSDNHFAILRERNENWYECPDFQKQVCEVHKLVHGVRNVEKLYICPSNLEILAIWCHDMPVFNNLTYLDIGRYMDLTWHTMLVLLRNCPHLETLIIKSLVHSLDTDKCGDGCICVSREDKGRSLIFCPVKKLKIREFNRLESDLSMIKHFLEYFPCLKEVDVYFKDRPQQFVEPLIPERLMHQFLTLYNDVYGRSRNVRFKVSGYLLCTAQQS